MPLRSPSPGIALRSIVIGRAARGGPPLRVDGPGLPPRRPVRELPCWATIALVLAMVAVLTFPPGVSGDDGATGYFWGVRTVDGGIDTGVATSLALDREGNPHIAYLHPGKDAIMYARWTEVGWALEVVDQGRAFFGDVSLVLDAADRPHLSYFQGEIGFVQYAVRNESGWSLHRVDRGSLDGVNSLALDSTDRPHIAYAFLNGDLRLAVWNGTAWSNETVDDRVEGVRYVSLSLNSTDQPSIAFYSQGHLTYGFENLYYAVREGTSWSVELVDAEGNVGLFARLALDSRDRPHIVYRDADEKVFRYAVKVGGRWIPEVVDYEGDTGWDPDIAVDDEDRPHVTYYERTEGDLHHALRTGTHLGWVTQVVDSSGVVGWFTSLDLDGRGLPHVSYYNWTGGTVKYAWASRGALIQTLDAVVESATNATLRAEVLSLGDFAAVNVSFDWRPAGSPTWESTATQSVSAEGPAELKLTNLTPERLYEYRARASVEGKTVYGEVFAFETPTAPEEEEAGLPLPMEILVPVVGALAVTVAMVVVTLLRRRRRRSGT